MNAYKHYSFDLWMTLIKSNPVYKQERVKFFYNNFNHAGKTLEEVAAIFRRVDLMCNAINEKTGGNIAAEEMYLMVISDMNNDSNAFEEVDVAALYNEMEQLFFKHLPLVYCENTAGVLNGIRMGEGVTVSILSNTAFIKGRTLREVLKMIELERYFDFQLYSDEAGFSKPDSRIFRLMLNTVASARNEAVLNANEIVHIGDNVAADIGGARAVGINSILVNSNNISITSLLN
jgi:putative hydrolase of the HAD superfamily